MKDTAAYKMEMDRRLQEQLLMLMLINSLRNENGANEDDVLEGVAKERDLSAISKQLLIIAQRLIDAQLLDFVDAKHELAMDKKSLASVASDLKQHLTVTDGDATAAAAKKKKAAAKKKRHRRKIAAAKRKQTKLTSSSWRGAGLIPKMIMMAFSTITMLIVSLSLVHHSVDGSGEGNLSPALPPTTSTSLRRGRSNNRSGNEASASPDIISSPGATVALPPVLSPRVQSFSEERALSTCLDTPNWKDGFGEGCDLYEENDESGCPLYSTRYAGDMGSAKDNCCFCGGGIRTCEDSRSKCQTYFSFLGTQDGVLSPLCKEAEACSCEDGGDFEVIEKNGRVTTVGLHNDCKCDFWSRICEDSGVGAACDYAAEYCCGDYSVGDYVGVKDVFYLDGPTCYCDFFNYAQSAFGYTLIPKAMNVSRGFPSPCRKLDVAETGWIANPDMRIYETESLMAIYNETNGPNWTNNAGWMGDTVDHCQWYGISCNGDGRVTGIDLRDNNLVGQFPIYPRDVDWDNFSRPLSNVGLANLFYLETLDLADNKLIGTVDHRPLYNLYRLTHFDISGNQLSGEMDALITPSIAYANFSNNRFTSMHRFEPFKVSARQTLRSFDTSNNAIKIDVTGLLENVPSNIEQFIASYNDIYGKLPATLSNLPKLRRFDVSCNALSGKLPGVDDSILSLRELDLSNQKNGFTGSIPEALWRFQLLKKLNLAGNKLTGTISPDIANMAVLQELDMSNNLLSGRIPPEIGKLEGILDHLDLSNNSLSGMIPSQLGQLPGSSVFLKGNSFDIEASAPLSLCKLFVVTESDLADDVSFCPIERNALSDLYDAAKGAEWTDGTNWMDEYKSQCDWYGVECVNDRVTELRLTNNGLSGRLSESIGNLTSLEVLDLSDNDIKGSVPTDIGLLSKLTYLRLSYNAFTGEVSGLANLKHLKLLQLQSNRITGLPNVPTFEESIYKESTFVTDCGVPSDFEQVLECENCTICCNADEDCYPQVETQVEEWGLSYGTFSAVLMAAFSVFCCMVALQLRRFRKNHGSAASFSMSAHSLQEDDNYALRKIGNDSVYSYFVTDKCFGWITAFATLSAQVGILIFFVFASKPNLQNDKIDIEFTWKCPRDSDVCSDKSDLTAVGWAMFSILMVAFLAKDMINGCKLIYHSSRTRHSIRSRIRYFIGGWSLCSITLFSFYVSTVYNHAIASSNTDIILNSVVVLFVMEMDESIFAAIAAWNEKWTAHTADSEDTDAREGSEDSTTIDEMTKRITSQQEELALQKKQIAMLTEAMQKMQASQAQAAASVTDSVSQCAATASESMSWDAAEESRAGADIDIAAERGNEEDVTEINEEDQVDNATDSV